MALLPICWKVTIGDATALQSYLLKGEAEEAARRSGQREIQQLVAKLRAEGKSKWDIDVAKRELQHGIGTVENPDSAKAGKIQLTEFHVALFDLQAAAAHNVSVDDAHRMCETLKSMDGREVNVIVTALLRHASMSVAVVTLPENIPCATGAPYVMLCHKADVSPKLANELIRDPGKCTRVEISPPLRLRGTVVPAENSAEEQRTLALEDPPQFNGTFLAVDICARAGVSVEPNGLGTFHLWNEHTQELAAQLVDSVKEKGRGLGNPEYKLKVKLQQANRPGHLYIKWAAACTDLAAAEIGALLEERLREVPPTPAVSSFADAGHAGVAEAGAGDTDKKIRALKKKLRELAKLKERRADDLDVAQNEKLAGEAAMIQQIRDLGGEP